MQNKLNKLIEKSNQGDLDATLEVGYCCANGNGVEQNHKEAIKWFKKVEKQGIEIEKYDIVAEAQHNIAACILCILQEDEEKENELIEYLKKAAENGYAQSQYALGEFYENGYGVEVDYEKAIQLYVKSISDVLPGRRSEFEALAIKKINELSEKLGKTDIEKSCESKFPS